MLRDKIHSGKTPERPDDLGADAMGDAEFLPELKALLARLDQIEAASQLARSPLGADQEYITAKQVCQRFGVSDMTLWRWLVRTDLGFPRPIVINGRRYFRIVDVKAWELSRRQE